MKLKDPASIEAPQASFHQYVYGVKVQILEKHIEEAIGLEYVSNIYHDNLSVEFDKAQLNKKTLMGSNYKGKGQKPFFIEI